MLSIRRCGGPHSLPLDGSSAVAMRVHRTSNQGPEASVREAQELFVPTWSGHHSMCGNKEGESHLVDAGVTHLVVTETIHAGAPASEVHTPRN